MTECTRKSPPFGVVSWDSYGYLHIYDGAIGYIYGSVYPWKYKKLKKQMKYGKGRMYSFLKKHARLLLKVDSSGKVLKDYAQED